MIFYKYTANQNHFILCHDQALTNQQIKKLCSVYEGIGADGLINILNHKDLEIYNADGSTAKICGNGLQCVACHLNDLTIKEEFEVNIANKNIKIAYNDKKAAVFFDRPTFIKKNFDLYEGYFIDCINNHFIIFTEDVDSFIFQPKIIELVNEYIVNVEAIQIIDSSHVKMRVYEYGVGETMACGSGSVAVAFLLKSFNLIKDDLLVETKGGKANITITDKHFILHGSPTFVFKGEISL